MLLVFFMNSFKRVTHPHLLHMFITIQLVMSYAGESINVFKGYSIYTWLLVMVQVFTFQLMSSVK